MIFCYSRMKIPAESFFRLAPEYKDRFSKFDEKGTPTHDTKGEKLTKSALKKLEKEKQKHIKQLAKFNK